MNWRRELVPPWWAIFFFNSAATTFFAHGCAEDAKLDLIERSVAHIESTLRVQLSIATDGGTLTSTARPYVERTDAYGEMRP